MIFYDYDITKKCFLNEKSLGTKSMKKGIAEFKTTYLPGTLCAKED